MTMQSEFDFKKAGHIKGSTLGGAGILPPPRTRLTDPSTSVEAAKSVSSRTIGKLIADLFYWLGMTGGDTHEDMIDIMQEAGITVSPSGLRTRCNELVKVGLVMDSGKRGKTASGRSSIIWALTPLGHKVAEVVARSNVSEKLTLAQAIERAVGGISPTSPGQILRESDQEIREMATAQKGTCDEEE